MAGRSRCQPHEGAAVPTSGARNVVAVESWALVAYPRVGRVCIVKVKPCGVPMMSESVAQTALKWWYMILSNTWRLGPTSLSMLFIGAKHRSAQRVPSTGRCCINPQKGVYVSMIIYIYIQRERERYYVYIYIYI